MDSDLYTRITGQLGASICGLFDVKMPDDWETFTPPVIVTQGISDEPTSTIDSRLALRDKRVQCSIFAADIDDGRAVKEALIVALHGWSGGSVKACTLESGGPELYEADGIPPVYHLPVDFMLSY